VVVYYLLGVTEVLMPVVVVAQICKRVSLTGQLMEAMEAWGQIYRAEAWVGHLGRHLMEGMADQTVAVVVALHQTCQVLTPAEMAVTEDQLLVAWVAVGVDPLPVSSFLEEEVVGVSAVAVVVVRVVAVRPVVGVMAVFLVVVVARDSARRPLLEMVDLVAAVVVALCRYLTMVMVVLGAAAVAVQMHQPQVAGLSMVAVAAIALAMAVGVRDLAALSLLVMMQH
jgi:hypothetical protein